MKRLRNLLTRPLIEYYKIQQWDGKLPSVTGADTIITMDNEKSDESKEE